MRIDGQIGEPGVAINAHPSAGFGELSAVLLDDGSVLALVRDPITRIIHLCSAPDESTFAFTPDSLGADRAMFGLTAIDGNRAAIRAAIMRAPDGALWITVSVFRSGSTGATGIVLDPDTDPLPTGSSAVHVYRSADSGATWQHHSTVATSALSATSTTLFSYGTHGAEVVDFAGAWHIIVPRHFLFLSAAWEATTSVYSSADGGLSWTIRHTAILARNQAALRHLAEVDGRLLWSHAQDQSAGRFSYDAVTTDGVTWSNYTSISAGSTGNYAYWPGWWVGEFGGATHGRVWIAAGLLTATGLHRSTFPQPIRTPPTFQWTKIGNVPALDRAPFVHVGNRWIWEMSGRQVRPWNITRGGWHVGRIGF